MTTNFKEFGTSNGEVILTVEESKLTVDMINQVMNYLKAKEKEIKAEPNFEKKQKALRFLSENAAMYAGPLMGDKYSNEWGNIIRRNGVKLGELTRALRVIGINARVEKYYDYVDGRKSVSKYIEFDYRTRRESITLLIKMLLDNGLNLKWASKYDPLEEYPTVKDKIDSYGGNRWDLLWS
jgi:hypothetical protein